MAINYNPKIITDNLVLCLDAANPKSYPGSGTTWTDLSGRGNTGTLVNGVGYSSANKGSLVFDGVDDYVTYNLANPYAETVIVWAKSVTTTWNKDGWISSSRQANGHIIHPNNYYGATRDIEFYVLSSSVTFTQIGRITTLSDITIPHMYVYTTNGSNEHKVYIDGTLMITNTTSITRTTTPSPVSTWIGSDQQGGRNGQGNVYNYFRYNRALSASEISQNYNATKSRYGL